MVSEFHARLACSMSVHAEQCEVVLGQRNRVAKESRAHLLQCVLERVWKMVVRTLRYLL